MNQCVRCKKYLEISSFYTGKNRKGGIKRDSSCKACRVRLAKEYHEKNREKRLSYAKSYRLKHRDRLNEYLRTYLVANKEKAKKYKELNNSRILFTAAKNRAAKRKMTFDLTIPWVEERIKHCALTGMALTRASGTRRPVGPLSPSVDRVNARYGYTKRNCRVVCMALNAAFQDWGSDEFKPIAAAWLARLANAEQRA